MDCKEVEELLPAFSLNALSEEEAAVVEGHLDHCLWCKALLREHLIVAASLADAAEHVELPPGLRARTMRQAGMRRASLAGRRWVPRWADVATGRFALGAAATISIMLLGAMIGLTAHTSGQIDDLERDNSRLTTEIASLAGRDQELRTMLLSELAGLEQDNFSLAQEVSNVSAAEAKLTDMLMEQRSISYIMASPDRQVLSLEAAESDQRVEGMLMIATRGGNGVLVAKGLESSQEMAYHVWLRRDGQRVIVGSLTVDDSGWGTLALWPDQPLTMFERIWVTEGLAKAAATDTATPVLWGTIVGR